MPSTDLGTRAAAATQSASLTSLLSMSENTGTSKVEYVIGGQLLPDPNREQAAQILADDAMRIRCGNSPALTRWRARRDGGPQQTGTPAEAVRTYAKLGFGLPAEPAIDEHLQGLVAELLWNRLIQERLVCRDNRRLVRAHSVKPDPLEPGGDGLVIYEIDDGTLVFRLWEIKKHNSQGKRVSATIGRASKQLASRGQEYLAKLAGPETVDQAGALGELYADIVELWLDRSDRAGVGVSVGTSTEHSPPSAQSFKSIATAFPAFTEAGQRESIVVALPDFPQFAKRVREIVWSGL
jgi:DNA-binding transcriptional LysR family regulator